MATNFNDIEDRLWKAADKLRANIPLRASEYSVPMLGLIFLKFADQKFTAVDRVLRECVHQSEEGRMMLSPERYKAEEAIYLDEQARYSYLPGLSTDLSMKLNNAMKLIERDNSQGLAGALPTSGYNALDNNTLRVLLATFDGVPFDVEGDLFGKIYECIILDISHVLHLT